MQNAAVECHGGVFVFQTPIKRTLLFETRLRAQAVSTRLGDQQAHLGGVGFDLLAQAIDVRFDRMGFNTIDIPPNWSNGYTRIATTTSLPEPLRHLDNAADTVSAWLNPLLSGELNTGYTWDHHAGAWRPPDRGPTVPGQVWVRPHTRDGRPITDHYRRRPQR